jgi:hypothetical protein
MNHWQLWILWFEIRNQKKNPFPGKETGTLIHLNSTHEKGWNSKDGERFDTTNSHTFEEARG